ncbi:MAG: orotidine-5'-phosphate decarboxylase [Rhodospirillales bacterium]
MTPLTPSERIFVALDTAEIEPAVSLAGDLSGLVGGVKLGKEFFTAQGPEGVKRVAPAGLALFLDLKFHDIPNTVAGAVRSALSLKPMMLTVHASGGQEMMRAAAGAAAKAATERPLVLGVTVLTSLDGEDLESLGQKGPLNEQVLRLARLAEASGLDGVVCSPLEVGMLRQSLGEEFKLVVPAIRPATADPGDQKRTMTPAEAIIAGADYLVIGRPITGSPDPARAARHIAGEIAGLV